LTSGLARAVAAASLRFLWKSG
jgi:hypothetical protein